MIVLRSISWSEFKLNIQFPICTVGSHLQCLVFSSIVTPDVFDRITSLLPLVEFFTAWFHHVILVFVKGGEFHLGSFINLDTPMWFGRYNTVFWFDRSNISKDSLTRGLSRHMLTFLHCVLLLRFSNSTWQTGFQ